MYTYNVYIYIHNFYVYIYIHNGVSICIYIYRCVSYIYVYIYIYMYILTPYATTVEQNINEFNPVGRNASHHLTISIKSRYTSLFDPPLVGSPEGNFAGSGLC